MTGDGRRPIRTRLAAVVVVGAAVRGGLGWLHPGLGVVVPPVVAVAVAVGSVYRLPRAVGLAVTGHTVAVAIGVAAFLLIDTPLRAVGYAVGMSPPPTVVAFGPFLEIGVGTLAGWGVLAPAVAVVARGGSVTDAGKTTYRRLREEPRRTAGTAGRAGVVGASAVFVGTIGFLVSFRLGLSAGFLVGGLLGTLAALSTTVLLIGTDDANIVEPPDTVGDGSPDIVGDGSLGTVGGGSPDIVGDDSPDTVRDDSPDTVGDDSPDTVGDGSQPTTNGRQSAVVGVLVVALITSAVVTAGVVRATETRPASSAAPLPENPSDAYETAVANTRQTDHEFTYRSVDPPGDAVGVFSVTRTFDRSDRQYRLSSDGALTARPAYADAGSAYPSVNAYDLVALGDRQVEGATGQRRVTAVPAFWTYAALYRLDGGELALPASGTGEWETVRRTDGELVVTLTDGRAVFAALFGPPPETLSVEHGRIEIRIDRQKRVVAGGQATFTGRVGGRPVRFTATYEIETGPGVDAERPASVGTRSPAEWLWKLLAY